MWALNVILYFLWVMSQSNPIYERAFGEVYAQNGYSFFDCVSPSGICSEPRPELTFPGLPANPAGKTVSRERR